jgi:hypothetical protein
MTTSVERFRQVLNAHFSGRLSTGVHAPGDGAASPIEAVSVARDLPWSDNPWDVGLPDVRPLSNGGPWSSDEEMTGAVAPVIEALWDWAEWPADRRAAFAEAVVLRTIREVLSGVLRAVGLTTQADACARTATLAEAYSATWLATSDLSRLVEQVEALRPVWKAAGAARAATRAPSVDDAAWYTACVAVYAARLWVALGQRDAADAVLRTECRIWVEAAHGAASGGERP